MTLLCFLDDFEDESFPDFGSPDSDLDSDDDEISESDYPEIQIQLDLEQFSKVLAEAQNISVEVEDERMKDNNRPRQYLKNSAQTKQRNKQITKDLEKQGYFTVKAWFAKSRAPAPEGPMTGFENNEVEKDQDSDVEMISVDQLDGGSQLEDVNNRSIECDLINESEMGAAGQDHTDPANDAQERVKELLRELQEGWKPQDDTLPTESDIVLDQMNYKNLPNLWCACMALTVKSKD